MNLKTTFFLLILAGGVVALFWQGPELAPKLGLAPKPQQTSDADAGTIETLKKLPVDQVSEVVIAAPDRPELTLKGHPLELLGNWPIRRSEVDELLATLKDLKSRYYPIPLDDKTDLKQFGLAAGQNPIEVTVKTTQKVEYKMKFGEAPIKNDENPFTRPSYVHLEGKNEIVRLGPQVIPILRRDEETYRKRQLFPEANRVRIAEQKPAFPPPDMENQSPGSKADFLLTDDAVQIVIESPSGRLVLHRDAPMPKEEVASEKPNSEAVIQPLKLANSWVITEPVRDRANPDKLRSILTALPNLWLEKFIEEKKSDAGKTNDTAKKDPGLDVGFLGLGKHPDIAPKLFTLLGGSIPTAIGETPLQMAINVASLPEAKSDTAKVTVTFKDGKSRTLQIGRVSRSVGRDEFRFAKLEDNPLVFELKADRLNDLELSFSKSSFGGPSSPLDEVRDPTLARFDPSKVVSVEIADKTTKGERITKLEKKDDNWNMVQPVAEPALKTEVTDLLKQLQDMQSQKREIIDGRERSAPTLAALGGLANIDPISFFGINPGEAKKITLTFDEKSGKKPVTFLMGHRDAKSNKRGVIVDGWSRINIVDDRADKDNVSRLDLQPSAYRAPKLFDRTKAQIGEVIVQREAAEQHATDTYTLKEEDDKSSKWAIVAPFKAEADTQTAGRLVGALTQIDVPKYVYDPATDAPLASAEQWQRFLLPLGGFAAVFDPTSDAFFGLAKPKLTITLKFTEPKGAEDVVIEIGRAKSPTEYYARRKGKSPLFLVPAMVAQSADHKPEEMVDRSLINLAANANVQGLRRTMGGQELEISQDNSTLWEITKPSPAKADQVTVDEFINGIRQLRAARIEAVNPKELKPEYGLNPPVATVTVEALEKSKLVERVLIIGNPVDPAKPDGERYVKAQGSTMVAVISADLAKKLTAPPSKFRDLSLGSFVNADKIVIERPDRTVTFVKGPTGWKMKEPLEADAEDQSLRDVHDALAKLRAEEIVEDKPKDPAKYGLDRPTHWRLFNGDKEVLHLLVGNREKIGIDKKIEGFRAYAKLEKGDSVVLLDPFLTSLLSGEFRKRDLWETVSERQITEVSIKAPNAKDSYNFVRGTLGWIDTDSPADKLDEKAIAALTSTLSEAKVERYVVDKGADLKKYGLDKPKILTVTTMDGKKRTLLLGDLLDGKRLYAKFDNPARTDVFVFSDFDTRVINRLRSDFSVVPKEPKKQPIPKKELNLNKQPTQILGAIAARDDGSWWFVKLMGPKDAISQQEAAFDDFVASIQIHDKKDKQLSWTLPVGWREVTSNQEKTKFRYATILTGPDERAMELSVSTAGGTLIDNVNRWRGQVGMAEIKNDELAASTKEVTTKQGKKITRVDLIGEAVLSKKDVGPTKDATSKGTEAKKKANP